MPDAAAPAPCAPSSLWQTEHSVGLQLRRIVTLLVAAVEQRMEPLGLTDAQWKPLLHLLRTSPLTATTLARECHMDMGGLTRLIDRLDAKGLCQRQRWEQDRRVVHIALTPEGAHAAAQLPSVLHAVQDGMLQGLAPDELAQLQHLLNRLEANASALAHTI